MTPKEEEMNSPLPSDKADVLIQHLRECPKCRIARTTKGTRNYCERGGQLIRLTLKERHG